MSALCPSTAQSIPGTAATSRRFSAGRPAWTSATTICAPRARSERDRLARGVAGIAHHDAVGAPAVGVGGRGRRGHAEDADAGPAGVDQAIGGEQTLAIPAVEVGRDDGDLERRGHLLQQRDADRQVVFARREGVDPAAGEPAASRFACRSVSAVVPSGWNEIARVDDQRRVGLGARPRRHGGPPRQPPERAPHSCRGRTFPAGSTSREGRSRGRAGAAGGAASAADGGRGSRPSRRWHRLVFPASKQRGDQRGRGEARPSFRC